MAIFRTKYPDVFDKFGEIGNAWTSFEDPDFAIDEDMYKRAIGNMPTDAPITGGNFDINRKKLTGKGVYAYADAEREIASDNRLGGSKSLYEKHISDRVRKINGIPRDPRRQPNPYNSIWDVFNY